MSTLSLPGSQRPPITTIEEGVQYEIDNKNDLPLTLVDNLGHGGTATVEKVQDQQTGTVFARKSFKFQGNRVEALRIFKNEVHVINRLAPHHHIVRVFATYIAKREVGLLITPVANGGSLDDLLQTVREDGLTVEESRLLSSSFSCLLSGLRFIHERRIRHKDIKPHNILVHDGSFLYTDFGGSLDYSEFTRSTTTGLPTSITKRYAAPEIHNSSPRSSATDIFSLGCVFFEILSALGFCPSTETLTPYGFYHKHMRHALTTSLSDESSIIGTLVMVKESTLSMLMSSPKQRPSAERLVRQHLTDPTTFCARCKIILLPIMLCTPVIEHSDTQHDGDESNNKKELTCPVCHVVCQSPSDYKYAILHFPWALPDVYHLGDIDYATRSHLYVIFLAVNGMATASIPETTSTATD